MALIDGSGAEHHPLYDNPGSMLRLVDATGASIGTYSYDPYGTRTTTANGCAQPFGYLGAYTNPTTGLVLRTRRGGSLPIWKTTTWLTLLLVWASPAPI